MQKISSVVLGLLLAACSASASPSTEPTEAPTLESAGLPASVCTSVSSAQERDEYVASLPYPPVTDADWQRGPVDAQVTVIEYGDFQHELSAQLAMTLAALSSRYPEQLRVVFRPFPLIGTEEQPIHDKAAVALQAAESAGAQGKFWEMHDALFKEQSNWISLTSDEFESWLREKATALELELTQFEMDLHSDTRAARAQAAWELGQSLEINSLPFVLLNGVPYSGGPIDEASLDTILQVEFLSERQFTECPPMALEPGASYTTTLRTDKGDIVIELFPEVAPMAVNSFIFLAEHDWFDNVTFHRVLPGYVAQTGDPTGTGYGGPGYSFAIEIDPELTFDRAGLLAMANSGPTSNGSQFFITLAPAEHLNGGYTIFGEVIQGMQVVESLTPRDPAQAVDLPAGDLIRDVTIEAH